MFPLEVALYVMFFGIFFVSEDVLGELWGWERLLPLSDSVEWPNYGKYLEKYYNENAVRFITDTVQIDTTAGSSLAAAVAKRVSTLLLLY